MPGQSASTGAPTALEGVRVVEIAAGLAVGFCAKLLAQCGAEVIRIEPPGGDAIRRQGPFPEDVPTLDAGGMHQFLNSGKRSVAIDVTTTSGAALAERLIASSALLVTSWKTPSALPLADPEAMRGRFPDTTYVSISEFGITGPHANYRADSHIIEALAGMSYVTGDPDREPLSSGVEVADYFAAVTGWLASLAMLLDAGAGERHHFVDVSMHESLTMSDDHNLSVYLGNGAIRRRYYSRILPAYPSDIMAVKDGYIAFNTAGPGSKDWAGSISKLVDRPELAQHQLFTDTQERVIRWREFDELIGPWMESHTVDEVLAKAEALGLGFGGVPTMADLLADEHLAGHDFWREFADDEVQMGPGARLSESPLRVGPAPRLGADNLDVLGVTPEENVLLYQEGA
jgi:crotonobetainyl-CoA:carnitine CoA-transferase CaiB-like acyl-CoA transferase